ncbi:FMN-binding protein [Lactobacillus crispatus]|nr:FMN-binding protein [Lactobacillus crispatus]
MEKVNSVEVDAVSGAPATSRAIKEAVSEAIKKAKN